MKRRTRRDLGILLGVLVIIGVAAFSNTQFRRQGLAKEYDDLRRELEADREAKGIEILSWSLIKKTKGSLRKGGTYDPKLKIYDGQKVNLMGFMVPQEQFRDVDEFLMLPVPIECYFCAMPPARDVMLVQLAEGETTHIFSDPVLINGRLEIHSGDGVKFFYSIRDAKLGPGETGGILEKRRLKMEHMLPEHDRDPGLLLPGRDSERILQDSD